MPTLQDAVGAVEERLFVGRERERVTFRCWLRADTEPPEILNVIGPSGVGKTALLHEFRRIAAQDGRPTVMLLGRDLDPPSGGLPASARGGHATAATAHAQEAALLLMVDALEEPSLPRQGLDALLSTLDCRVKLLIAGRRPLHVVLESESLLLRLVREVPLCGLSPEEARTYLERRGLSEPHAVGAILDATGGYPLALSLAADMASRGSAPDFEMGSAWRLTAHSLVTRLIPEGDDARLRTLLDIGAVVRQFDETTLAAVSGDGEPEAREEFDQLCSVAVFEPAEHGLRLRPDVRPLVGQDLRWRRPHRHAQIRDRALAHSGNEAVQPPRRNAGGWSPIGCSCVRTRRFAGGFSRATTSGRSGSRRRCRRTAARSCRSRSDGRLSSAFPPRTGRRIERGSSTCSHSRRRGSGCAGTGTVRRSGSARRSRSTGTASSRSSAMLSTRRRFGHTWPERTPAHRKLGRMGASCSCPIRGARRPTWQPQR